MYCWNVKTLLLFYNCWISDSNSLIIISKIPVFISIPPHLTLPDSLNWILYNSIKQIEVCFKYYGKNRLAAHLLCWIHASWMNNVLYFQYFEWKKNIYIYNTMKKEKKARYDCYENCGKNVIAHCPLLKTVKLRINKMFNLQHLLHKR